VLSKLTDDQLKRNTSTRIAEIELLDVLNTIINQYMMMLLLTCRAGDRHVMRTSSVALLELTLTTHRKEEIKDSSAASSPPARTPDDVSVHFEMTLLKLTWKPTHMKVQDSRNASEIRVFM